MTDFLKEIYEPRSFKNDMAFKKKIKEYRRAVPTFEVFDVMIETIQELELVFMYDNSPQGSNIYTLPSKKVISGMLPVTLNFDYKDILISIQLERVAHDSSNTFAEADKRTNIIIKRKLGTKIETKLRYKNNDADTYIHSKEDMMLYGIIEDRIMTSFCDLLEYFYYNGPHRSIDPRLL